MQRTKNTFRNIVWGFIQKIIKYLLPFVTRTIFIQVLGGEYLGLDSLFLSLLHLLSLTELGVSDAIISSLYKPVANNDKKTISAMLNLYRKIYLIVGFVMFSIGIAIIPVLPFLIKGDVPAGINISVLFILHLINTTSSYVFWGYRNCLFIAYQRVDVVNRTQVLIFVLQNIIQIVLLILFRSYYFYIGVIPIFSILTNACIYILTRKYFPEIRCEGTLEKEKVGEIKKKVSGLFISKIATTIRSTIDSVFISAFFGLKITGMYSNYYFIVTAVAGVIQLLEPSMVASVGNSIEKKSVSENYANFRTFTFLSMWIVSVASVCVLCLVQPFIFNWVGSEYLFEFPMTIICALYVFIITVSIVKGIYVNALGLWWDFRLLSVVDIGTNLFLNYFIGKLYGPYGILVATILDIALFTVPITTIVLFKKYFKNGKEWACLLSYARYLLALVPVGFVAYMISSYITIVGWGGWILKAMICFLVTNVLLIVVYYRDPDFRTAYSFVNNSILSSVIKRK